MCGELEEDGSEIEEVLYARFAAHVHSFLADMKSQGSDSPLHVHLNALFRESLTRSADSESAPETVGGYDRSFLRHAGLKTVSDMRGVSIL